MSVRHVALWLALGLWLAALPARAQDAGVAAREGTLGDCTITVVRAQYWRSAIMMSGMGMGMSGHSPDGFAQLIVSVGVRVTCASATTLRVAGAFVTVGATRRALHRPELYRTEGRSDWDGHVEAGVPIDVTFTWRDGGYPGRDARAGAIVRFRTTGTGPRALELVVPTGDVAFVS